MASASDRMTTIVSTKGQVILPKAIRDHRRWPAGTRLIVEEDGDTVILRAAPPAARRAVTVDEVFGCLKYDGPPKSLADMDAGVLAEARRRARD